MKIIETDWEKRNFGMDAYEIALDKKDLKNFDDCYRQIQNQHFKNSYVVIKIPVGNIDAVHKLEDDGYRFLETQLYLVDHFEPTASDTDITEYLDNKENISYTKIPKEKNEWEKIIQMITPGMFDTDRISLDPKLGKEVACKRYQNWCRDLFNNQDAKMVATKYNDEICGFVINIVDKKNSDCNGILGGFFEKYKNMGIGITWIQKSQGLKTAVSSNNLNVLKIHQHCGRIIYKERYVLRKIYN